MLVWSAATVLCIVGSGISLFKVLLVTRFDIIFNQDPERLGKKVLLFSLIIGVIPHCVIGICHFNAGTKSAPVVAYLMGEQMVAGQPSSMQVYGTIWLIISVAMLLTAVIFIPNYMKRRSPAAILASEHHDETMRSISIVRVFLGSSGVTFVIVINIIAQSNGITSQFPVQTLVSALLLWLQLLVFSLHENILKFIGQNFPSKPNILRSCYNKNKVTPEV
jgi:hypothetical protein